MESIKQFEWYKDSERFRLAWVPPRGKDAYWVKSSNRWGDKQDVDRSIKLEVHQPGEPGTKPRSGLYITGFRGEPRKHDAVHIDTVRPFSGDEVVSMNILRTENKPNEWLKFVNKYGMIRPIRRLESTHIFGREKRLFYYEAEHEGEWHYLRRVLGKIYGYSEALKKRDTKFLKNFIQWDSRGTVREDEGVSIGGHKIRLPIHSTYSEHFKKPDVFVPAASALRNTINRYFAQAISYEVDFDVESFEFSPTIRFSSLGAALVGEAMEFMVGHFEARQCNVCSTWFRVGETHRRRDRVYCSAACKMRDYRSRKSGKN
jgi:hypothetical protein